MERTKDMMNDGKVGIEAHKEAAPEMMQEMLQDMERRVSEEAERARSVLEEEMRRGIESAVSEFKRQEGLSEDERINERMKALDERERRIVMMEMRARAAQRLAEKGLPVRMAEVMAFEDEEACDRGIDMLDRAFREAVQAEVVKKLGSEKPMTGVVFEDPARMSDEQYYSMKNRR